MNIVKNYYGNIQVGDLNLSRLEKFKIDQLKTKIYEYTNDMKFKRSKNMGEILKNALDFVKRNYENHHTSGL